MTDVVRGECRVIYMLVATVRMPPFAFRVCRTADRGRDVFPQISVRCMYPQAQATANTHATSDRFVSVYCTCREGRAETGVCAVRAIRERNETHNIKMLNHPRFRPEPRRQSPQCPVTNAPESRVQRQQCVTQRQTADSQRRQCIHTTLVTQCRQLGTCIYGFRITRN